MTGWRGLLPWWLALAVLLALECGGSFVPLGHTGGLLLLLPGIAMALIVVFAFMRLRSATGLARIFALFGLFWLVVLLSLGSMDALTRIDVPVQVAAPR